MSLHEVNAWIMVAALILYVLLGGADFGAGVWDLLATGSDERRRALRFRIGEAIGPIWEANHVWLILVVVILFTCFPPAFAALTTALHVPITLALVGVVMRGSAFVFRKYTPLERRRTRRRWGRLFAGASLLTPVLLGVTLGTAATGELRWDDEGVYISGFLKPWLHPFPWSVGFFALAIFAYLAAVYLCAETEIGPAARPDDGPDPSMTADAMRDAFRARALSAAASVALTGLVTWLLLRRAAPLLAEKLDDNWWAVPLYLATGGAALGTIIALWRRRYLIARACAAGQVILIVLGYALAMMPHIVVPQFTTENSAAPPATQRLVAVSLACGTAVLAPSMWYLYRVFKGERAFAILDS